MGIFDNYKDHVFLVKSSDTRIRSADDIWSFLTYTSSDNIPSGSKPGDYILVPKSSKVVIKDIKIVPAGERHRVFANISDAQSGKNFGWTSTANLLGEFRNITLGVVEPVSGAGKYSETAAWSNGVYVGQISLVVIVDNKLQLERLSLEVTVPYSSMVKAAANDGVDVSINSGFRSYAAQKYLYENWKKGVSGFNLAAKPGHSNHQNGSALDIPVSSGPGLPVYDWLATYATSFGFIRTVKKEYWHWEYRPIDAARAKKNNKHTLWE